MSMEDPSQKVNVKLLRKGLQRFNEDLGQLMNSDARYKLGRVLTVIDAAISDPEQRKAIKDLIQNQWWDNGYDKPSEGGMSNPHNDIRNLCEALGFDLYEESTSEPSIGEVRRFNRYEEILGIAQSSDNR